MCAGAPHYLHSGVNTISRTIINGAGDSRSLQVSWCFSTYAFSQTRSSDRGDICSIGNNALEIGSSTIETALASSGKKHMASHDATAQDYVDFGNLGMNAAIKNDQPRVAYAYAATMSDTQA